MDTGKELVTVINCPPTQPRPNGLGQQEWLAFAWHELKSPLTCILTYSDLLERTKPLTAQQNTLVSQLRAAAWRMNTLMEELFSLAQANPGRPDSPGQPGRPGQPCSLAEVIEGVFQEFGPLAATRNQQLSLCPLPGPLVVCGNPVQLGQVVANLVSNGIKYTPAGGAITLSAEVKANVVWVWVQDTGVGILPADLPFLFDPYYRAQSERVKAIEGSGLGLAIVRCIVEQHGGQVAVTSEGIPGKGSQFGFSLPLLHVSEEANPAKRSRATQEKAHDQAT
jgi:signal transduction histidine kinase